MAQNILIGISGGIAAYKIPQLIRLLKKQGDNVRIVMSEHAHEFVTATTLQAVSGEAVRDALFDPAAEQGMGHIELARWADAYLIAPASANTLGKLAHGIADNLLTTLYLATSARVLVAPAMNCHMLAHPAVQANLATLAARPNHLVIPSDSGSQACGDVGAGRLPEPEILLQYLNYAKTQDWRDIRLTVTAGPTREAIDPVRYLTNHSSGKMGYALAAAAARRGAAVTLISGPTALPTPPGVTRINIESAADLLAAALAHPGDIYLSAAAVADYRVEHPATQKQKKQGDAPLTLTLVQNPDVIATIAALPPETRPYTVGFAAETENLLAYARAKRARKNLDLIIANDVSGDVFGADDNSATLISAGQEIPLPRQSKNALAESLLDHIRAAYSHFRK